MNRYNYKRYILNRNHSWCEGYNINTTDITINQIDPHKWNMKKFQITDNYSLYSVGYNLYPIDDLKYLKTNKSYRVHG